MGKFETQQARRLIDIVTAHQEALALLDDERMYAADRCAAGCFVDDVAQVAG